MNGFVLVVLASAAFDEGTRLKNIGEYARAAELYEQHARAEPADADAKRALTDAIMFRLALGDETNALSDAEQYLRAYASSDAESSATVAAAIVLHEADEENWAAVTREAARKMSAVDRGPLGLRMQTHAALARALVATHDPHARGEYARVRDMSRDLHGSPNADPTELRKLARGLDALGEALVFAADEKRDATVWAPLAASPSADAIASWTTARVASIRAVEAEYQKITEIQPAPPPRWVVAAAARSAAMWTRAADELATRLPAKKRAERIVLRDVDAKSAAKACVDYAAKYQWSDDGSRACGAWLEKNFRREFPPLDELAVTPRLRAANPAPQGPLPRP